MSQQKEREKNDMSSCNLYINNARPVNEWVDYESYDYFASFLVSVVVYSS